MKSLTEFMMESLNESKWQSVNGTFSEDFAENMHKQAKDSYWKNLKNIYKALDNWEEQFGGPIDSWEFDDKTIKFTRNDGKEFMYNTSEEEWTEVK